MFTVTQYPQWSWSHSRDQLFRECRRRYYYHYYAAHNGWLRDATAEQKTAYQLKQLTNLYLHFGDVLHQVAEMYVRQFRDRGHRFTFEELLPKVRHMMNQAVLDSRDVEQWQAAPKKRRMLAEMYYYHALPDKLVYVIKERMTTCLENLLKSESVHDLLADPTLEVLEIEQLNTMPICGDNVYVKLDLLLRQQGSRYVIVDWKTGQEDERIEEQLYLYAYYLHRELGVPLDDIEIRTEYLLTGECKKTYVAEPELWLVEQKVAASTAEMKACLANAAYNEPLPLAEYPGSGSAQACRFCNFRAICDVRDEELA